MLIRNDFLEMDIEKFHDLPCNIYLKDRKGVILYCNDFQAKCTGFSQASDIIGANNYDFLADEAQSIRDNDNEVLAKNEQKVFIEKAILPQSTQLYLSYKMPLITLGKSKYLFGMSLTISKSNQLWQIPSISIEDKNNSFTGKNLLKREQECLRYLVQGMSAKRIARQLGLPVRTVEYYIAKLREKFNCKNRIELIMKTMSLK